MLILDFLALWKGADAGANHTGGQDVHICICDGHVSFTQIHRTPCTWDYSFIICLLLHCKLHEGRYLYCVHCYMIWNFKNINNCSHYHRTIAEEAVVIKTELSSPSICCWLGTIVSSSFTVICVCVLLTAALKEVVLYSPLHRWGNQGSETPANLLKACSQQVEEA